MPHSAPHIVFIVGPTAVGKSEVALEYAQAHNAEIIACDAMQVYREINIASDKPSIADRQKVVHYGIDVVSVTENFNVAQYRQLALSAIADIHNKGKLPLIVGGSGMYMTVLLDGIFEEEIKNEELRAALTAEASDKGSAALHERLKQLDPAAALKIHPNDPKRIVRALEIVLSTGQPFSQLQQKRDGLWGKYSIEIIALERPREELYARAEVRIDHMFERGLIDEVKAVIDLPLSQTAKTVIGIPEVSGYLKGEYDLERAKYLMKLNTRHFIKRQFTWFRRDKRLQWKMVEEKK